MKLRHHAKRVAACLMKCGRRADPASEYGYCRECEAAWQGSTERAEEKRLHALGLVDLNLATRWMARRRRQVDPANGRGAL